MEATMPGKTGVVVPRKHPQELAQAMFELYMDADKRHRFGQAGRKLVCETYELNRCFEKIAEIYSQNSKKQKGAKTPV